MLRGHEVVVVTGDGALLKRRGHLGGKDWKYINSKIYDSVIAEHVGGHPC